MVTLSDFFISIQLDKDFCLFFLCLVCITPSFQLLLLTDSKDMILNCGELFIVWDYTEQLFPQNFTWAASFSSFRCFECHLHTEVFSDHRLYWDILVPSFMFVRVLALSAGVLWFVLFSLSPTLIQALCHQELVYQLLYAQNSTEHSKCLIGIS